MLQCTVMFFGIVLFARVDSLRPSEHFFSHDGAVGSSWVEQVTKQRIKGLSQVTQHINYAGDESRTISPSIPSLSLYQLSHCTPLVGDHHHT